MQSNFTSDRRAEKNFLNQLRKISWPEKPNQKNKTRKNPKTKNPRLYSLEANILH